MSIKSLVLGAALLIATTVSAQQAQPAGEASKDIPAQAQQLALAGDLVRYGYQTKTALPLIQAVQIYKSLNVTAAASEGKTSEGTPAATGLTKTDVISYDEAQLLADAAKFADGNKNLLALVQDAKSATRGAVGGPIRRTDTVNANCTDTWTINFRGGQPAYVVVSGDGDTDLDLYVYDENGNFITSDTDSSDDCVVSFNPRWTGKFYIKIKNLGRVYNRYVLATN